MDSLEKFAMSYLPAIYKRIHKVLKDNDDIELAKIAEITGCVLETAREAVVRMRRAKIIRISSWRKGKSGPPVPSYSLGSGKDVARPPKRTASQKCRDWRDRKKAIEGTVRIGVWGL